MSLFICNAEGKSAKTSETTGAITQHFVLI